VKHVDRSWRQAAIAILVGVGLALVLGYGGIWPQAAPGATSVQLDHTLIVWSGFPAGSGRRPLVLAGSRVLAPAGGFPDKADLEAFTSGAIDAPASLPSAPSYADGYELIQSADAVTIMQTADATGPRLRITRLALGMGTFQTDRGPRTLPAWRVWFAGVKHPALVAAARAFNPAGLTGDTAPAIRYAVASNDRRLTITYTSVHPCERYQLKVAESHAAVAVAAIGVPGRVTSCSATRQSTVTLTKPLDGRVLVDGLTGDPVTVVRSGRALGGGRKVVVAKRHRLHGSVRYPRVADQRV
jgi:hypothetical protein